MKTIVEVLKNRDFPDSHNDRSAQRFLVNGGYFFNVTYSNKLQGKRKNYELTFNK